MAKARYTKRFKRAAVLYAQEHGVEEACVEYKLYRQTLGPWMKAAAAAEAAAKEAEAVQSREMLPAGHSRNLTVETLIVRGWSMKRMCERLSQDWGLSEITVSHLITKIRKEQAESAIARMAHGAAAAFAEHRDRIASIFDAAMEKVDFQGQPRPDLPTALKAAVTLATMDGFLGLRGPAMPMGDQDDKGFNERDPEYDNQVRAVLQDYIREKGINVDDLKNITPKQGP